MNGINLQKVYNLSFHSYIYRLGVGTIILQRHVRISWRMASERVADASYCEGIERLLAKVQGIKQTKREWDFRGSWLRAGIVHYTSPDGALKKWEMVERTSHGQTHVDGTEIIGMYLTLNIREYNRLVDSFASLFKTTHFLKKVTPKLKAA